MTGDSSRLSHGTGRGEARPDERAGVDHFVIDGIGPFFRHHGPGRINWSKIPFAAIERDGRIPVDIQETIAADFETVCRTAASWGYTTITLDDLAHLALLPGYDETLKRKLEDYRIFYARLIAIAGAHGLSVWFTTDIMFFHPVIDTLTGGGRPDRVAALLTELLEQVFDAFPGIAGIVFRIGETDAHDVEGDFLSRLLIRSPRQGNAFLRNLLPVFERRDKLLVFRTWSVGAYKIGDLLWSRDTYDRLFEGLDSDHLLVSIKYGESDFFRYLRLNPLLRKPGLRKIVEFQARREYEGFGEYPAFIGRDYARYRDELADVPGIAGISVWCQTGGWSAYRRLTFLEPAAVWNEINTWTTIRLFRDGMSVEGAVRAWFQRHGSGGRWDQLLELLEHSEDVIRTLLYMDEFAARRIYFRRLRVPPLLAVYWDHLFINGALRTIHRCFVIDRERNIRLAGEALEKIDRMKELAGDLGLPVDDLMFQRDTFAILALAREFYFRPVDEDIQRRLHGIVDAYRVAYGEHGYDIIMDLKPWRFSRARLKFVFSFILREHRRYRWIDRIFTLRILAVLYAVSRPLRRRLVPEFARKQAMGIDTIFK